MDRMRIFTLVGLSLVSALRAGEEFNVTLTGGNTSSYVWAKTEGASPNTYITLKAKKGSLDPVVFLSKEYTESRFEFVAKVSLVQSGSANSEAGLMVRTSRAEEGDWAKATLTKGNKVLFQRKMDGVVEASLVEYTVIAGKDVYFKAFIDHDRVDFFISNTLASDAGRWHRVGPPSFFPTHFFAGFCLIPKSGTTEDIGRFSQINFRDTRSTGGLAKTSATAGWLTDAIRWIRGSPRAVANGLQSLASAAGSVIQSATDVVIDVIIEPTVELATDVGLIPTTTVWEKLFSKTMSPKDKFGGLELTILGRDLNASWNGPDLGLDQAFDKVSVLRDQPLVPIAGIESQLGRIIQARKNADIYLADMLANQLGWDRPARKHPAVDPNMLYFRFVPAEILAKMDKAIKFCHDATQIEVYNPWDWITTPVDAYDCVESVGAADNSYDTYKQYATGDDKDKMILEATSYAFTLNLMTLLDEDFHFKFYSQRKSFNRGLRDWVERTQGFYFKNNIPIKAYAAIALGELPKGVKTTYTNLLKPAMERKTDADGVYAEGTGYLNYVNEELGPLLSMAYDNHWLSLGEFPANYAKTGTWLLKSADPSGDIPGIDDGNAGRHFWLGSYGRFTNNPHFRWFSNGPTYIEPNFPDPRDNIMTNRKLLSYPFLLDDVAYPFTQADFYGSVGKLNVSPAAGVNSTLTILAENGNQKTEGHGHDQQDNSSITVNRHVANGSNRVEADNLIIDPPYGGYGFREKMSSNRFHNTVLIAGSGVAGNGRLSYLTAQGILMDAFPNASFIGVDLIPFLSVDDMHVVGNLTTSLTAWSLDLFGYDEDKLPKVYAGGSQAYLDRKYTDGMVIRQTYEEAGSDQNRRAVFKYGNDFVVIDAVASTRRDYEVHYNLPKETVRTDKNLYIADDVGASKVMLAIFGEDEANTAATLEAYSDYPTQARDAAGNPINREVRRLHYRFNGPTQSGGEFGFITVISPRAKGEAIPYAYRKAACPGTSVCVERSEGDFVTYFFLNEGALASPLSVRIPASPRNVEFAADARYGFVKFSVKTGAVAEARLYEYSNASVSQVALNFPVAGAKAQGTVSNTTGNGSTYILAVNGSSATQTHRLFNFVSRRAVSTIVNSLLMD